MPHILASVTFLHIPDGFLSLFVAGVSWLVALAALALAARRAQAVLAERLVPLAGVVAAFIFAAQMINFPIAGGTSGHMVGAALAFIVLGPWLGMLSMAAVIILQALLFQDGGLVVMGANLLVMGVVPGLIGYGLYRLVAGRGRRLRLTGAAVAAWLSIMAAALVTALLLGFSGTSPFRLVVPALLGVHALIGVGEALITVGALTFILRARPDLLGDASLAPAGKGWVLAGIALALGTVLLAPFASGLPDGLEWVAQEQGFLAQAESGPLSLLAGYQVPGLGDGGLATVAAGLVGALLVGVIAFAAARLLRRQPLQDAQ